MKKLFYLALSVILLAGCAGRESDAKTESHQNLVAEGADLLKKGDIVQAVKVLQEAVVQDPQDTQAAFILAQLFLKMKNYDQAAGLFQRITEIDPANGHAYLLLGGCYDLLGKRNDAIESVKKSVAVFEQKKDEQNFKQSLAVLRSLMETQGQPAAN